jgi:peptidyl-prolyl cis-trans isomerase B (cyclophilin B)
MVLRAEAARRRRQLQLGIASGVAVLLLILGTVWIVVESTGDDNPAASPQPSASAAATPDCQWLPQVDPSQSPAPKPDPNVKDVGTPPATPVRTGSQTMTMTTNKGVVEMRLDTADAPCSAASYTYLASKKFFDNTKCHRLTTEGIFVLQCGDPSATGSGGPSYRFAEENLPEGDIPTYPEGTVAMARSSGPDQQPIPNTAGSQFFIVYKDSGGLPASYAVIGKVTKGLDIVQKIGEAGAVGPDGKAIGDGKPKEDVTIQTLTVSAPQ